MIDDISVNHHIQKYIIDVLMYKEIARFTELKPPKTDTNLFSYHLNKLVKSSLVEKVGNGYQLSFTGLSYVDRVSSEKKVIRSQPKIVTMIIVQNSDGLILLQKRTKQPYINAWTFPYGKLHIDDDSAHAAALREVSEKLKVTGVPITHAGDCYVRVHMPEGVLSTTLVHVYRMYHDDVEVSEHLVWAKPHKLRDFTLAPAVEAIMGRTFFNDPFFFEEFDVDWYTKKHEYERLPAKSTPNRPPENR